MVRSVASRYRDLGLPFEDLVQEGSLGLLEAIEHYDPCHGTSFDGYARFRVRRAIRNALTEQARLIRLPKQVVERRRAIDRAEAELAAAAAGRAPTAAQIAAATGLSVEAVLDARSAGLAPLSLDEPVLPDGSSLASVVADPEAADPELNVLEHEQTARAYLGVDVRDCDAGQGLQIRLDAPDVVRLDAEIQLGLHFQHAIYSSDRPGEGLERFHREHLRPFIHRAFDVRLDVFVRLLLSCRG